MAIPFGYFYDSANNIAIEPSAAAVVRRIFDDFTRPYSRESLSEIAAALNTDDIPTARGGKWHASTVRYVLSNPTYARDQGWPPIISTATFEAAQYRFAVIKPGPPT